MNDRSSSALEQWEEAEEWLARADSDVQAAEVLVAHGSLNLVAAFHCQQAIEKMAKAVLIAKSVAPPRIHDIEELGLLIEKEDRALGSIFMDFRGLTNWYVPARYPGGMVELELVPSRDNVLDVLNRLKDLRLRIGRLAPKPQ